MSGFPYIGQVTDPNAQKALKAAFELINELKTELDVLQAKVVTNASALNANNQRIINVADPQGAGDAANAGYVRAYATAQVESFKGLAGVDGTILTASVQTIVVERGLIVSIV